MVRNMRWAAAALVLGTASVAAAQSDQETLGEKAERTEDKTEQAVDDKVDAVKMSGGANNFGQMNQLVISQDFNINMGFDLNGDGQADQFNVAISPSADFFIQQNLSIGGFVTLAHSFREGDDPTDIGVGVRAGYNQMLAENASVWPRIGFSILNAENPQGPLGSTAGETSFIISLDAPVLFHPANHFFVGFGPAVSFKLGGVDGVGLSLNSLVGGYF
jgi:hypothetical protein